ncbi:hypothetical protein V8E53_012169 [Lactarius tabidus]
MHASFKFVAVLLLAASAAAPVFSSPISIRESSDGVRIESVPFKRTARDVSHDLFLSGDDQGGNDESDG